MHVQINTDNHIEGTSELSDHTIGRAQAIDYPHK